ncbi:MAG: hypothetical protein P4L69_07015 [Desulfosporosinus sp.]|nr:hypothetical protein [Desulfosporosinus sp.]
MMETTIDTLWILKSLVLPKMCLRDLKAFALGAPFGWTMTAHERKTASNPRRKRKCCGGLSLCLRAQQDELLTASAPITYSKIVFQRNTHQPQFRSNWEVALKPLLICARPVETTKRMV